MKDPLVRGITGPVKERVYDLPGKIQKLVQMESDFTWKPRVSPCARFCDNDLARV